jgi:hypothetical protein
VGVGVCVRTAAHAVGRGHAAGAIAAAPIEPRLGVGDVVQTAVEEGQHVSHAPSVGRGHSFVAMLQHLCDGLSTKQRERKRVQSGFHGKVASSVPVHSSNWRMEKQRLITTAALTKPT